MSGANSFKFVPGKLVMLVKRFPYDPIEIAATGLGVLIVVALALVF